MLKVIMRLITGNPDMVSNGAMMANEFEDYLQEKYFSQGWKLFSCENIPLGELERALDAIKLLVILVK